MKGFVSHNPIQGLENLPFDEAMGQAKHLFGAEGYLSVDEYRGLYRDGRITDRSVDHALARLGPTNDASLTLGSRTIAAAEVQRSHFLHGIDALEPALFDWTVTSAEALSLPREGATTDADLDALWRYVLSALDLVDPRRGVADRAVEDDQTDKVELPFRRALSDWVDEHAGSSVIAAIDRQVIKWVSSFVDEGMAGWGMPGKRSGFFAAWRELAQHDASGRLLGIKAFTEKVRSLPADPEAAIQKSLETLEIPESRWPDYLMRVLGQLPGWTGLIRWRGLNPEDPIQKVNPIDITQYLAVRLFYEVEFVASEARRHWNVSGTLPAVTSYLEASGKIATASVGANKLAVCRDAWRLFHLAQLLALTEESVRKMTHEHTSVLLGWLDAFPPDRHRAVWLEAYEDSYRHELLSKIAADRKTVRPLDERPLAQAAFCIDVRSEPFRRHFEQTGAFETFGYAGFFGIPMDHRNFDTDESFPLCPVLLTPGNALVELPREDQDQALESYASGSRWKRFGEHLFHELKHNPVAAFLLVDVVGLFFSAALLGKTMLRRPYRALVRATRGFFLRPVVTEIKAGEAEPPQIGGLPIALTRGFSIEQQANFVEGGLRTIGLTDNFARFIVLCGHGSTTDNNPYFAALDCGACGGRHGDPTARTFAVMGNDPVVRAELEKRGLSIPEDTWFLPAKHNTTADRVEFYDLVDLPESFHDDLQKLRDALIEGGEQQALERCGRIPGTPRGMTPKQAHAHVEARGFDWANTRPEWGLSGNAAFIIARRALTQGSNLNGRCFLHSYDATTDPEGAILERIMTAPLVVGEWINMQYYTSATDPWKYGSGSKVIHNIVSGVGVMYGAQSDLATGLPLQTVNNGEIHFHEPLRLLAVIEAAPSVIGGIIAKHEILQQFFHNGWVNLVAVDPIAFTFHRYNTDATWEAIEL
jgi:uncharacterized protein YbcC (UPF0753/DUF2309 family)